MLGKTHLTTGVAVSLLLVKPDTLPMLIVGGAAAAIGSVISDIDSDYSDARQKADMVLGFCLSLVVSIIAADAIWHFGIYESLRSVTTLWRMILGAGMFIVICAYGRSKPHRTFMHSVTALILLTANMEIFAPIMVAYFIPAFWTHLILDLLNRRRVRLFWPLKKGYSLRLCSSDGFINHLLFSAGCVGCAVAVLTSPAITGIIETATAMSGVK